MSAKRSRDDESDYSWVGDYINALDFTCNPKRLLQLPRVQCARCNARCTTYCRSCLIPCSVPGRTVPAIELPFVLDILIHYAESTGKSTVVAAAAVAPTHTTLTTWPILPFGAGVAALKPSQGHIGPKAELRVASVTTQAVAAVRSMGPCSAHPPQTALTSPSATPSTSNTAACASAVDPHTPNSSAGLSSPPRLSEIPACRPGVPTGPLTFTLFPPPATTSSSSSTPHVSATATVAPTPAAPDAAVASTLQPSELERVATTALPRMLPPSTIFPPHPPTACSNITSEATSAPITPPPGAWLLYPTDDATVLEEMAPSAVCEIGRVAVVEATWFQASTIAASPVLSSLPKLKIGAIKTMFWRHQRKGQDHLATIEAAHYVAKVSAWGRRAASVEDAAAAAAAVLSASTTADAATGGTGGTAGAGGTARGAASCEGGAVGDGWSGCDLTRYSAVRDGVQLLVQHNVFDVVAELLGWRASYRVFVDAQEKAEESVKRVVGAVFETRGGGGADGSAQSREMDACVGAALQVERWLASCRVPCAWNKFDPPPSIAPFVDSRPSGVVIDEGSRGGGDGDGGSGTGDRQAAGGVLASTNQRSVGGTPGACEGVSAVRKDDVANGVPEGCDSASLDDLLLYYVGSYMTVQAAHASRPEAFSRRAPKKDYIQPAVAVSGGAGVQEEAPQEEGGDGVAV